VAMSLPTKGTRPLPKGTRPLPKGTRPLPKGTRPLLRDSSFYKDANLSEVTDNKLFNFLISQLFTKIEKNEIKTIEEIDEYFDKKSFLFLPMTFVNKEKIIESNKNIAKKKLRIQQRKQRQQIQQTQQTDKTHQTQGGNKIKKITRKVYLDDKGKSYIKYDNKIIYLKLN
jgi:hypothetical protein